MLMRPVVARLWRQHETWDGTYTVHDLLDAIEMLDLKAENDRRRAEWEAENR